ncbi:hypothetical protein FB451DRAFT_1571209 [Mycena latifolia]|nr:hypothetical protein FB451DRAFT_1571209 [Mycena latifolia]
MSLVPMDRASSAKYLTPPSSSPPPWPIFMRSPLTSLTPSCSFFWHTFAVLPLLSRTHATASIASRLRLRTGAHWGRALTAPVPHSAMLRIAQPSGARVSLDHPASAHHSTTLKPSLGGD